MRIWLPCSFVDLGGGSLYTEFGGSGKQTGAVITQGKPDEARDVLRQALGTDEVAGPGAGRCACQALHAQHPLPSRSHAVGIDVAQLRRLSNTTGQFDGMCRLLLALADVETHSSDWVSVYLCDVGTLVSIVVSHPVGSGEGSDERPRVYLLCGTAQEKVQQLASKACKAVKEVGELTDEEAVLAAEVQMEAFWVQNRAHLTLGNDSEAAIIAERVQRSGSGRMCPSPSCPNNL